MFRLYIIVLNIFLLQYGYAQATLEKPILSHDPGFYETEFELNITHPREGVIMYYTLDGSKPTERSAILSGSIIIKNRSNEPNVLSLIPTTFVETRFRFRPPSENIPKGTILRIKVAKEGYISNYSNYSFFVFPEGHQKHKFVVISISTDSKNLFSDNTGIYVPGNRYREGSDHTGNYYQRGRNWERESTFEFFDENGVLQVSQNVGLRIHGGLSRRYSHKSLRIYSRSDYGESRINYEVFPELPYNRYNRLILRSSGQDQGHTMFRDAFAHSLVSHLTFDTQASRPSVVYINGEYWGIHNIRERYDRHYLVRVYGVDPDNVDLLSDRYTVNEGDNRQYRNVVEFIESRDLSIEENMSEVEKMIDIDNFLDYYSAQNYFVNFDWPHKNIDFWRLRTDYNADAPYGHDGRWRWMMFDVDEALMHARSNMHGRNSMLDYLTRSSGMGGRTWANTLLRNLLENEQFKNSFINRMADLLNTAFLPERVIFELHKIAAIYEPEMPEYITRWNRPVNMNRWHNYIIQIQDFAEQRPVFLNREIIEHFYLSSTINLIIDNSLQERSPIKVNSILISPETPGISTNPYPWTGTYFSGIPVTLTAPDHFGVQFNHWEINGNRVYDAVVELLPDTLQSVKAVYEEIGIEDINPYPITSGTYYFDQWAIDAGEGTYPPHMAFVFMDQADPGLDARVVGMTFGEYGLDSRTRIEGLGDEGIGFINTASAEGNPGYPGTRLGGAVLVLDTRGVDGVQVGFEAGTVRPNSRVYHLRLQYRLGSEGSFSDVLDGEGNPVEYRRSEMQGHSEFIGPVALPEEAIGQPRVELLWRYYHSGEQVDESSGQRTMISLSAIHVAEPVDGLLPAAHVLTNTPYEFSNWTADSPPGSAPPSMGFVYMDRYDPGLDAGILGFTSGAFDLDARTRVEGLGEDGFALINTASLAGNPGYPGRRLGGAVLNLNTEGQGSVTVEWTGGTVRPNFRVYHLRLQYRTSVDEPFRDVVDATGEPVEYRRFEVGGHRQRLGPVTLPGDAGDQPWVQLLWRYYYTGEREEQESGQRAMLHIASIRVYSYALLGGEPGMPAEFRLYQNYPNPFYPQTTIRFDLPRDQHVRIDLFTITGRRVATLEDAPLRAGRHSVQVDASALASGVYLYRLHSEEFTETGKLSVIK
jgi:hypothetical protein